jgi:iron complex outermembrane recepter protein
MTTTAKKKSLVLAIALAQFAAVDAIPVHAQILEEVVVTARKRVESLMDAPLSVTAVGGDTMDKVGINNMEQLSSQVPGLQVGRGAQTSSVFIRGVGSGINKSFEQSVGMYVDGIYQSRSRQFTQSLVDLQQVEVLRGPQGTLFGKNTVAGAIKVQTATTLPGDSFHTSVTLDHEFDQETTRGTVVLGGSPSENLGARLAIRYQESDGYIENHTYNRDEAGKDDLIARLSLAWDPRENLRVIAKVSYTDMEADGTEVINPVVDGSILNDFFAGTSHLDLTSVMGTIAALAVPGYEASTGGKEYDSWNGNTRYNNGDLETTESTTASLNVEWDLGNYTFTSLTGYSDFDNYQDHDVDFHGGNVVHDLDAEELEMFSQEFRVASNFDGRFNFIAGLYYEKQDLWVSAIPFIDGSLGGAFGALPANAFVPGLPDGLSLGDIGINSIWHGAILAPGTPLEGTELTDIWRRSEFEQDTETLAVFAEFSYELTDALTLEVGMRYSEDSKDVIKQGTLGIGSTQNFVETTNSDGEPTGAAGPLETALVEAIWGSPSLATYPHNQKLDRDENHFDPAVRLRWEATDDTMAYVSWSEGYKSGGFNFSPDTANPDGSPRPDTEYEDEGAEAWELGVKTTAWDGRARLSTSVFRTEITDLQVTSFQGATFQVGNAAELTVQGLEFETQLALTENLEVGGSLAYLDHEYDSYATAPCTAKQQSEFGCTAQDLSGKRGAFAPAWSGTFYADYSRDIGNNWLFSARLDVSYKDEFFTDGDLDPGTLQGSYTKLGGRLALASSDERWEVALYGRNLTDEATLTASVDSPLSAGILGAWIEEPRVVGLQLRYNL